MILSSVIAILDRDLRALRREIEAYPDEASLWLQPAGLANSAGTLALHLAGNVQHYFGAKLGATGYVRDRPAEFARRDVSRTKLIDEIEAARQSLDAAQLRLGETDLTQDFPELIGGLHVETGDYLIHLVSHFNYHLGQLDYHRRVVTGQTQGIAPVRTAELRSAREGQA
ncbi:MAG TPA: DinB family protein [Gemmatimonadales bacterium]|jgi:uncharacterized damage-inducible protein DinB